MRNYRSVFIRSSAIFLILLTSFAMAEEVVVSDDGRQIRLNDDGTWVQLSQDRFATNAQGQRIRLRADGKWNVMSAQDTTQGVRSSIEPVPLQDEAILYLKSVEILRREIKRSKSRHAETRMRYVVGIENNTADTIRIDRAGQYRASTNRGGEYALLSVTGPADVSPGATAELVVVVADSPTWFGVKHLSLEVPESALGNAAPRILNKNMNEVRRVNVDEF